MSRSPHPNPALREDLPEREDDLDWRENQQRTAADVKQTDAIFFGFCSMVVLGWMTLAFATVGGVAILAIWYVWPS